MTRIQSIERIDGIALVLVLVLAGSSTAWAAKCDLKKGISAQEGRARLCRFDAQKKSLEGTPAQQASYLTREVKRVGNIGAETITPFLKEVAGKPTPSVQAVQALTEFGFRVVAIVTTTIAQGSTPITVSIGAG